ncbi:CNNM domain-containing protein [Fulvivirga lutimaris]|uniref:CNNM domain-containing protein n=1 Tax=Fulvivirga lutimaris TaxID=1819566 RepID=UPI0012BB86E9|nr:hemolysin family protein [Fulvivirga lutimaris]MTI39266.1 HlyC/CorC family transporter [Fulvivirga lutimaris]
MTALIFFFVLSIAFSFLCSILEAVLLSVTPRYIKDQQNKGTTTGDLLAKYKEDIDRPLSAILTLNTIAHTVGAIGVGAKAGEVFGANFFSVLGFEMSYESIIAVVMTLAILILSEIIPKTIGANNWQALSPFTVNTIRILMLILSPLVWLSQLITRSLKKEKVKSVLSRSDIMQITLEGESSGVLAESESTIIKNLLALEENTVRDIMTPRSVAFMAHKDLTVEEYIALEDAKIYSRVPIYNADKDDVVGIVLKDDVFLASSEGKNKAQLFEIMRKVDSISDTTSLNSFFNLLRKSKAHLFMVKDEFGNVIGLVSMEDLFEEMLGHEIVDESDTVTDLQDHARKKASDGL